MFNVTDPEMDIGQGRSTHLFPVLPTYWEYLSLSGDCSLVPDPTRRAGTLFRDRNFVPSDQFLPVYAPRPARFDRWSSETSPPERTCW